MTFAWPALTKENIGEGVGVNGVTTRLRVDYEPGSAQGPASLVLKLPAALPASKEIGLRLGFYENEIRFYDELASSVSVNLPRHYYTGMDKERQDYALLLEDMAPAAPGDDIASCSWEEELSIVDELPKLHAPWWNSPRLASFAWLPVGEPNVEAANARFQEMLFPATMKNYGDTLSETAKRVSEKYSRGLVHIVKQMTASPFTLTHSDYRLVNMLLGGYQGRAEGHRARLATGGPGQGAHRRGVLHGTEPGARGPAGVAVGPGRTIPRGPAGARHT